MRAVAGKWVKLSAGGTQASHVQRWESAGRFFLCFSLTKDLHVLLCGCKLLSTSQEQTLNSLFFPQCPSACVARTLWFPSPMDEPSFTLNSQPLSSCFQSFQKH